MRCREDLVTVVHTKSYASEIRKTCTHTHVVIVLGVDGCAVSKAR